jgi:transcription antitermination factor NusG
LVRRASAHSSGEPGAIQSPSVGLPKFPSETAAYCSARTQVAGHSEPPFSRLYLRYHRSLSKHRWRSINGTFGVASLIMGGEQPMPVPPGVVEALVASCESHGVVRLDDGLEIGQKVRILSGPFAETICRLAHLDDRGRVRVLLEIMGMEVATQLDRSAIAPAA